MELATARARLDQSTAEDHGPRQHSAIGPRLEGSTETCVEPAVKLVERLGEEREERGDSKVLCSQLDLNGLLRSEHRSDRRTPCCDSVHLRIDEAVDLIDTCSTLERTAIGLRLDMSRFVIDVPDA